MSTTTSAETIPQTNENGSPTHIDLTTFAGCTPSEWLIPDKKNTKSLFKYNILKQMTREIPLSDSLVARLDTETIPWAQEFIIEGWQATREGPFKGTLAKAAYWAPGKARSMTNQLADLVNCFFFTWLRDCFRRKIELWWEKDVMDDGSATSLPFTLKETRMFARALNEEVRTVVEEQWSKWEGEYKKLYCEILDSETWRRLGQRVGTFCRDLGCPDASDNAREALNALRHYNIAAMRDTTSWRLQVTLDEKVAQIKELESRLELYQKAIACLSFRGLLENLPDPQYRYRDGQRSAVVSATSHWKNFLAAAGEEAKSCSDGAHPFATLAADPDAIKHGEFLYSTLSDNIHGFSQNLKALENVSSDRATNEFTFKPIQFDPGKSKFLEMMVPENRLSDGSVNYEKERERYGVVWDEKNLKYVARSKYQDPSLHVAVQATPAQVSTAGQPPHQTLSSSEVTASNESSGKLPPVIVASEPPISAPRPPKKKKNYWGMKKGKKDAK